MGDETLFNKVWVIESLRKGDRETGKALYNAYCSLFPFAKKT